MASEQVLKDRLAGSSGWDVQRQLGRGQYGTAYLVEWSGRRPEGGGNNGTEVGAVVGDLAVAKVVGLEFLPEKEHTLAFQEVELMRKLRHPNIVSLRDHFLTEAGIELVIVMDFCDSGDLRGEVKRRAGAKPPNFLLEEQVMMWFVQLTLALNYIHQRHILHRDLKSSNIFLTGDDAGGHAVRIGDFGIARVLEGTIDVAATVVGTPYYMSPEVCKSEPYGYKSDIWALGCVLYEMCMLKHAFESQSLLGLVYKIVSETYDPIPAQYSGELRSLLDRVLDKSHYTRPTGKDLVADPYVKRFAQPAAGAAVVAASAKSTPGAPPLKATVTATGDESPLRRQGLGQQQAPKQQAPPPKASLRPPGAAGGRGNPRTSLPQGLGVARGPEATPLAPEAALPLGAAAEEHVRRRWVPLQHAAPDKGEVRVQVLLRRVGLSLAQRRQNWLQVFASFDRAGNGQLQEAEFVQAMTSLALGLSDAEIREVRTNLQQGGACVPVDRFGAALHHVSKEALQIEEWGRGVLADLAREAATRQAVTSGGGVAPGAHVKVQGLTSVAGLKLNGCEGIVDKWDPANCRWVVKMSNDVLKSIRDEQLLVLRAAAAQAPGTLPGGVPDSAALYRLLCEGGETAVPVERFLAVVQSLLPRLGEENYRNLMLLLPKSPDGRVDTPEVLAQFVGPALGEQTLRNMPPLPVAGVPMSPGSVAARRTNAASPQALRAGAAASPLLNPPVAAGMASRPAPPANVPGAVISPRSGAATAMPGRPTPAALTVMAGGGGYAAGYAAGGGGSSSSTAPPHGTGEWKGVEQVRQRAEVALLRFAQRLLGGTSGGRSQGPGPGLDVLKLFCASPEEVRLEELCDAASVMPLGISRAEVQSIFAHVRAAAGTSPNAERDVLPFPVLASATEAAAAAGVPWEAAAGFERLDISRLSTALQRLGSISGGRASPQDFRFSLMQAEPYLTPLQLDWLVMLTDKDGEGRLLPWSLLARLAPDRMAGLSASGGPAARVLVPPRPPGTQARGPVAQGSQRSAVLAVLLFRVRATLRVAGAALQLAQIFTLFELDSKNHLTRSVLASLLGQLRLGISMPEADELICSWPNAAGAAGQPGQGPVALAFVCEAVHRAAEGREAEVINELHEAARLRLEGRGQALALNILSADVGDHWVPEVEFRRCLAASLAETIDNETEDQLLLLADKNASGDVLWRPFTRTFAGWEEPEDWSEFDNASPQATRKNLMMGGMITLTAPSGGSGTQQSWREKKAADKKLLTAFDEAYVEESQTPAAPKKCGCWIS